MKDVPNNRVDYSGFRLNRILEPQYRHLLLLIYWPIYLIVFVLLERCVGGSYQPVRCFLDDVIPFCEYFIVPYLLWFPFWIGMLVYAMLYEISTFKKTMWYFILTFTLAMVLYLLFPNCQELRPTEFPRDNFFTWVTRMIYWIDTNTNVCPSEHVIGAFAVVFAAHDSKRFSSTAWQIIITAAAVVICIATLFVKQHSAVDIAAASVVCAIGYLVCFRTKGRRS